MDYGAVLKYRRRDRHRNPITKSYPHGDRNQFAQGAEYPTDKGLKRPGRLGC
jgi:hypothetical protein